MLNITAHGNLGKDPELSEYNGQSVARFTLACDHGKDETTWMNCSVWGKRAQTVMSYLHKGDKITIAGSGKLQEYQAIDGTVKQSLSVSVSDFTLPARDKTQSSDSAPF